MTPQLARSKTKSSTELNRKFVDEQARSHRCPLYDKGKCFAAPLDFCEFYRNMRAVIQRVSQASVTISGNVRAAIQRGLVVLVAIEPDDTTGDVEWLSGKIVRLRIFPDEAGVMNRSVQDVSGEILLISQFTLFASTKKGNRPSYSRSAKPELAIPVYEQFKSRLAQDFGKPIQTGEFGADMIVTLSNDGPVTIIIDSKNPE